MLEKDEEWMLQSPTAFWSQGEPLCCMIHEGQSHLTLLLHLGKTQPCLQRKRGQENLVGTHIVACGKPTQEQFGKNNIPVLISTLELLFIIFSPSVPVRRTAIEQCGRAELAISVKPTPRSSCPAHSQIAG